MKINKYFSFLMMISVSGIMLTSCSNNENNSGKEEPGKATLATGKKSIKK